MSANRYLRMSFDTSRLVIIVADFFFSFWSFVADGREKD